MQYALVFGYAQESNGYIDNQTKDRCSKAADLYNKRKIQKILLTVSAEKNGTSMAVAMKDYLLHKGVSVEDIFLIRRGRNTAGEMDIFLSFLPKQSAVTFVSTWYHIPRIVWLALWRKWPWHFKVKIAWRHAHFKGDVLKEILKMANAILRPYRSSKITPESPAPP